jgi:hypothetical protein
MGGPATATDLLSVQTGMLGSGGSVLEPYDSVRSGATTWTGEDVRR